VKGWKEIKIMEKKRDKMGGRDEDNLERIPKVAVPCVSDVVKPRKPPPGYSVSQHKFEPSTFQIQVYVVAFLNFKLRT